MNKEQIYDERISPLMAQVIGVCKEHGIAMVASFSIPTDEDSGLCCTTCIPDENGNNGFGHKEAFLILRNEKPVMHLRTDHGDGSVTMTAIL